MASRRRSSSGPAAWGNWSAIEDRNYRTRYVDHGKGSRGHREQLTASPSRAVSRYPITLSASAFLEDPVPRPHPARSLAIRLFATCLTIARSRPLLAAMSFSPSTAQLLWRAASSSSLKCF